MEFSIANGTVSANAFAGKGEFSHANENIRVAAVLFSLYGGFMVRADSDIQSIADLKGRKLTADYPKQKTLQFQSEALLNTVGLSYDDVEQIPVPNGVRGVEDFETGAVDATFFSLNSGRTLEADAAVGGIRILPVDTSDEAIATIQSVTPGAWVATIQPGPGFPGVSEPIGAYVSPFVVLTNSQVADDVVYNLVKALHDNKETLAASAGAFNGFDPAGMSADIGVPFHPGAQAFYDEMGM